MDIKIYAWHSQDDNDMFFSVWRRQQGPYAVRHLYEKTLSIDWVKKIMQKQSH